MKQNRLPWLGAVAALLTPAWSPADDSALIAQVAAERSSTEVVQAQPAPSSTATTGAHAPAPATADSLAAEEASARAQIMLGQVRLLSVQARKASTAGDHETAAGLALKVLQLAAELPKDIDSAAYELQAEGVLVRAERAGVRFNPTQSGGGAVVGTHAAEFGQGSSAGPSSIRLQSALRDAYQDDAVRELTNADATRLIPAGDIAYPADWPERIARRQRYAGGEIARSRSWTDADGREWYAAVYDVSDLTYVPPDFGIQVGFNLAEDYYRSAAYHELLLRGNHFNGLGNDVFSGIGALDYFGPVDPYLRRGPAHSAERQQQIVEMIRQFAPDHPDAKVVSLPPQPNFP